MNSKSSDNFNGFAEELSNKTALLNTRKCLLLLDNICLLSHFFLNHLPYTADFPSFNVFHDVPCFFVYAMRSVLTFLSSYFYGFLFP